MSEKDYVDVETFRHEFWLGESWSELLATVIAWSLNWLLFLLPGYAMFLAVRWLVDNFR